MTKLSLLLLSALITSNVYGMAYRLGLAVKTASAAASVYITSKHKLLADAQDPDEAFQKCKATAKYRWDNEDGFYRSDYLDALERCQNSYADAVILAQKELERKKAREKAARDKERRKYPHLHIPEEDDTNLTGFKTIAGCVPTDIKDVIDYLQNRDAFIKMGVTLPRGYLLVGHPGTGKTAIVRALTEEIGIPFVYKSATEFANQFVGESANNVRKFFAEARQVAETHESKKAIAFVDEIDAIGSRSDELSGSRAHRDILNEFLTQMDGFKQDSSLIIMGATNAPGDLDPALKRPGRFDRIIEIPLPDQTGREEILKLYTSKVRHHKKDVNISEVASKTEVWSPADLKNLVNEAGIQAVRDKADCVMQKHFDTVIERISTRKADGRYKTQFGHGHNHKRFV